MASKDVLTIKGYTHGVDEIAINCPFCHAFMTPRYLFYHEDHVFAKCDNSICNRHFVLGVGYKGFDRVLSNWEPEKSRLVVSFARFLHHLRLYIPSISRRAGWFEPNMWSRV